MGKYVVFDGMDGSGKGTQLKMLENLQIPNVVFTREPGGTPFAEEIRRLVRDDPRAGASTPLNNFLLFWAAREELLHNLVMPVLASGKHVFSDRADSSTYAFQIYGEEREALKSIFFHLESLVYVGDGRKYPDLYIVFDLPAEVARARALADAERTRTHFDVRPLEYYERVRQGFRRFADVHGYARFEFVDANRAPILVHRDVEAALEKEGIVLPGSP